MTLIDAGVENYGGDCVGTGGYDDIRGGAQVVVRGPSGDKIALGHLDAGEPRSSVECVFPFTVEDIPIINGIYSVEVSHRGEVSFTQDDAQSLDLTLG